VAVQPSPFHDLWQEAMNKGLTPSKEKAAREWMRNQAKSIKVGEDPVAFIKKADTGFKRRAPYVGFMYQFEYDAKNKDDPKKLPYWDRFPLIFPIEIPYLIGFLVINLHYLNRPTRARLMDALYNTATNKKYNDNQRLAISYGILKASAKYAPFKPCVKMYLWEHVRSPFFKIPSQYWDVALFLPTERFVRKPKTYVWGESARIIRGG
jgi:hypothetical protein